jgi:hypothetical protein
MSNYSIIDVISQCCYPLNIRDYIGTVLVEVSKLSSSAKFFKIQKGTDQVIAIKYNISTTFKDRKFDIPVLIYILKTFPYSAPEVYLERTSETGVSPKCTSIDPKTNRISANILNSWNINSKLGDLITEVTNSFNANFPIYKLSSNNSSGSTMNSSFGGNNSGGINTSYTSNFNYPQQGNTIYSQLGINTNTNTNNNNFNMNNSGYNNFNINQTSYVPQNNINNNPYGGQNNFNFNQQQGYQNQGVAPVIGIQNKPDNSMNNNNMFNSNNGYNNNNMFVNNNTGYSNNNNYQNFDTSSTTNTNSSGYNNTGNKFNSGYSNTNVNTSIGSNQTSSTNVNSKISNDNQQEEIARKVLVDEIRSQVEGKVKEELKRLKQQEEKLKNYQTEFNNQIDKYQKFLGKRDEILVTLKPIMDNMVKETQEVLTSVANSQDRMITQDTALSFINIGERDKTILNIISMEATIEDIITATKKGFEKGIVGFSENTKFIRNLTRELFRIKYYRDKLLRG